MTDISPSPPPRRPNKSRLRTLPSVDQISTTSSSIHSTSPLHSPNDERHSSTSSSNESHRLFSSPAPSIDSVLQTKPEKSKYRSRFTEHFDQQKRKGSVDTTSIVEEEEKEAGIRRPQRPDILKSSQSLTTFSSTTSAPTLKSMNQQQQGRLSNDLNLPLDPMMTTSTTTAKRVQLTASVSTPLQIPLEMKPRKYGSSGSLMTNNTSSSNKLSSIIPVMSLNRADIIITRLESWSNFLKSVTQWVEEVSKINITSSRHYYQRAYPFLEESSAISTTTTKTTQDASTTTLVQQNVNSSILTVQAGFQVLTMQIAAEQQEFSKALDRDYLPNLIKLRKECKEKIHKLKHDTSLALDELLRRAEITRNKMMYLNRCCKQASKEQGQAEMDPWVANLLVLRQLKREVDEENRLRLLMIPIQKEAQDFEARLINHVKPTIQHCYEKLAPGAWDGSSDKDTAPFQLLLEQVMPTYEWDQFVETRKKELVDEKNPTRDYRKINYPNRFHPLVMTLMKGKMERKFGVRKQFTERNYVLSQGGYLHQFRLDDKVSPEKSIYIPSCTIVPSIDINLLSTMDMKSLLENTSLDKSNRFEICRPASNVLQRDKISVFRTSNREELIKWCRLLIQIASGVDMMDHDDAIYVGSGSNSFDESEINRGSQFSQQSNHSSIVLQQKNIDDKRSIHSGTPASSPARSIRSIRTEESFNEPAAMSKRRSNRPPKVGINQTTEDDLRTPTTIPEEYLTIVEDDAFNNTDAESFVTARFTDNEADEMNDEDDENHIIIDNYFPMGSQKKEDDDNISIASTSTAKGPTSSSPTKELSSPQINPLLPNTQRSPSLAGTTFDDAQSSLYFSSGSAPPSPSQSDRSSIVSIPEFELEPEATDLTTTENNNNHNPRLSAAEMYKATLTMKLDVDE